MGVGDAYTGLVDLLSHNGKFHSVVLRLQALSFQKIAPIPIARFNV